MKQWPTVYCEKAAITIIQQGSGWSVAMALQTFVLMHYKLCSYVLTYKVLRDYFCILWEIVL